MIEVRTTRDFDNWLTDLTDQRARNRIAKRLLSLRLGLIGDHKSVGDGVSEIRIDEGPGYRLYFARRGMTIIVLLCGGDKGSQRRDILKAKALSRTV